VKRERNRLLLLGELKRRKRRRKKGEKGGFGKRGIVIPEGGESRGAGEKGLIMVLVRTLSLGGKVVGR